MNDSITLITLVQADRGLHKLVRIYAKAPLVIAATWVLKSQKAYICKLVLVASQIFLLTLAQLFFAFPFSDPKIANDTLHGDLASHQSMTLPSLSLSKRKC